MEKKTKKTKIFRFIYIGASILVLVIIGLVDPNFRGMFEALSSLNIMWLYITIAVVLLYWLTDAWLLKDITSYIHRGKFSMLNSIKVSLIGLYYGALTPSSTGGQPMQVVYMRRRNINTGTATCIVFIKFIVYELALCTFYILAAILKGPAFRADSPSTFWLTTLGFLLNALIVIFVWLTMVRKKFATRCAHAIIRFLHRIKVIKDPAKATASFDATIEDFHSAMQMIKKHRIRVLFSYLISFLNLTAMFSVIYCLYRAMGLKEASFISIVTTQAFLYLATSIIPTPGSAGAAEGGFYIYFSAFFLESMRFVAMLMWRLLTYYLVLFVGTFMIIADEIIMIRRKKKPVLEAPPGEIAPSVNVQDPLKR